MIVTPNNIKECHEEVLKDVYREDYYINLLPKTEPETIEEMMKFWHDFWWNLPDSGSIRREPFFKVCDIAEVYGDPEFWREVMEEK